MKSSFTILIVCLIGFNSFSQGSWNIGYIEVDSINKSDIGKTVNIDFKHEWLENNKPKSKSVRRFIGPRDSAEIFLDNKKMNVIEKREIYADHGSFNDQYLELETENKNKTIRIYNSKLIEMEPNRLKFTISMETFEIKNGKLGNKINTNNQEIWIYKKELDGLMIKL